MGATPALLFLIFNRPETTATVFAAIRQAKPARLYIAADGARPDRPGEAERCAQARRIATQVDWPCEVRTLFRDTNLGCRDAVSGAITWFFDNEPEGVILEDDVIPDRSFFTYCHTLLARYRNDPQVMAICGASYCDPRLHGLSSYSFCRVFDPWGWASWRRAWALYDKSMPALADFLASGAMDRIYPRHWGLAAHWSHLFKRVDRGETDTWDYQWIQAIFQHQGLVAYPRTNLVSNIGFGDDATHTTAHWKDQLPSGRAIEPLEAPIAHPAHLRRNLRIEAQTYTKRYNFTPPPLWKATARRLSAGLRRRLHPAIS